MRQEWTMLPWVAKIGEAFPQIDFAHFHQVTLLDLVARRGSLVQAGVRDLAPMAFQIDDGSAYRWDASEHGVRAVSGTAGAKTIIQLSQSTFSDHMNQLISAVGAVHTGRARILTGQLAHWREWEPAIRSLIDGRPIYDETVHTTLVDDAGQHLVLNRSFNVDDPLEDMAHFLRVMGYLHVRSVFTQDEIVTLRHEVEKCCTLSTPGDPRSWWSLNSMGEELVTRINHCERFSPIIEALAHDRRLAMYAGLAAPFMRVCDDRLDGPMVFIKHPDVVEGKGDLWWHIDDGIGGSPVMNPLIQAGVQLDHANADNGQVLFMAGSHRYHKRPYAWGEEGNLPIIALNTEPGDLTLHFGDTMHSTPPPLAPDAGRRVLYYKFAQPKTFGWVPAQCHYNDALFGVDEHGHSAARATTY